MGKAETKNKNVAMASRLKQQGIQRRNATCPICHAPQGGQHSLINHMAKCGGNYQHVTSQPPPAGGRYPLAQSAREKLESMPKPGDHKALTIEEFDASG